MTEQLELCPCKKGHLRPTGQSSIAGEVKEPFRQTGSMSILICDNCGMKKAVAGVDEYVDVSESVRSIATAHRYRQVHRT